MNYKKRIDDLIGEDLEYSNPAIGKTFREEKVNELVNLLYDFSEELIGENTGMGIFDGFRDGQRKKRDKLLGRKG